MWELAAEIFGGLVRRKERPTTPRTPALVAGLKVERRIADCHNFRDAIHARRLHRVEEHERGGPSRGDVVTANGGDEILRPSETAEDGGGDCAIEACRGGHEVTGLAEFPDSVFGAGNGWDGAIGLDELRGEFVVDGGGESVAVDGGGERLTVDEMADDLRAWRRRANG